MCEKKAIDVQRKDQYPLEGQGFQEEDGMRSVLLNMNGKHLDL